MSVQESWAGLTRVAHLLPGTTPTFFCTPEQIGQEIKKVTEMILQDLPASLILAT